MFLAKSFVSNLCQEIIGSHCHQSERGLENTRSTNSNARFTIVVFPSLKLKAATCWCCHIMGRNVLESVVTSSGQSYMKAVQRQTIVLFSRDREAAIWWVGLFPEGFGRGLSDSESVLYFWTTFNDNILFFPNQDLAWDKISSIQLYCVHIPVCKPMANLQT